MFSAWKKSLRTAELCTQVGKRGFFVFFFWVFFVFFFLVEALNTVAFLEYPITNLSSHYKHLRNVPSICLERQL